eukprot:TRINITY_DN4455_c0_g2_i2.p1 TRINITY_DN4455_c0_g2~~TRINITY_DN4455_c0_g2_i2.p1  ORF type:complete len:863 (+),score=115.94 TRINITY_DN4455_c0_g2_i2:199-2589(+)
MNKFLPKDEDIASYLKSNPFPNELYWKTFYRFLATSLIVDKDFTEDIDTSHGHQTPFRNNRVFRTIDEAHNFANKGDFVYLRKDTTNTIIKVTKPLHIFGEFGNESNKVMLKVLWKNGLQWEADGGSISHIYFQDGETDVDNINVTEDSCINISMCLFQGHNHSLNLQKGASANVCTSNFTNDTHPLNLHPDYKWLSLDNNIIDSNIEQEFVDMIYSRLLDQVVWCNPSANPSLSDWKKCASQFLTVANLAKSKNIKKMNQQMLHEVIRSLLRTLVHLFDEIRWQEQTRISSSDPLFLMVVSLQKLALIEDLCPKLLEEGALTIVDKILSVFNKSDNGNLVVLLYYVCCSLLKRMKGDRTYSSVISSLKTHTLYTLKKNPTDTSLSDLSITTLCFCFLADSGFLFADDLRVILDSMKIQLSSENFLMNAYLMLSQRISASEEMLQDAIKLVLWVMAYHSNVDQIQIYACEALFNLSEYEQCQKKVAEERGIVLIVDALRSRLSTKAFLSSVQQALYRLLCNFECRQQFHREGGSQVLISSIRKLTRDTHNYTCFSLNKAVIDYDALVYVLSELKGLLKPGFRDLLFASRLIQAICYQEAAHGWLLDSSFFSLVAKLLNFPFATSPNILFNIVDSLSVLADSPHFRDEHRGALMKLASNLVVQADVSSASNFFQSAGSSLSLDDIKDELDRDRARVPYWARDLLDHLSIPAGAYFLAGPVKLSSQNKTEHARISRLKNRCRNSSFYNFETVVADSYVQHGRVMYEIFFHSPGCYQIGWARPDAVFHPTKSPNTNVTC